MTRAFGGPSAPGFAAYFGASNGIGVYSVAGAGGFAAYFDGTVQVNGSFTVVGGPKSAALPHPDGSHRIVVIGPDVEAGQRPQVVVPRRIWQGARLLPGGHWRYALLGTTVAPGFDYTDYETAPRADLLTTHPAAKNLILALTR